jgi:antitoxin (DNA-binding transcriptional repressor) of toxin-antitoxin stability system
MLANMTKVTVHQAKTQLSKLIVKALAGEEIVIHRGDEPVVRLTPIVSRKPKRVFGAMRGTVDAPLSIFEPMNEDELSLWEGK